MALLCYAAKFDPFALHPGAIQGKEGIKFCHLATLAFLPSSFSFNRHFCVSTTPNKIAQDQKGKRKKWKRGIPVANTKLPTQGRTTLNKQHGKVFAHAPFNDDRV